MSTHKTHFDILRISDSSYKAVVEQFINRTSTKEILIHTAFYINIATLLATFLLGFNLAIDVALRYIVFAYLTVGVGMVLKLWLAKTKSQLMVKVPLFECIDDLVFLCAIPVVYFYQQTVDILLVIYFVLGSLFVSSFFTIKYLHNYLIAKFIIFWICIYFVTQQKNEYLSFIYTVFSLATIYILLICLACWIHIRQIRLYHLNASYLDIYQKVEAANNNLNELKDKRDKLIRHIGHDLRQPINAIEYALFNIQTKPLNTMQQQQLDNALHSVDDINIMIEAVLKLATDKGAHVLVMSKKPFDVNNLLTVLYNEYKGLALEKGSQLRVVSGSVKINSDEKLLARILRNFLSNAIKYGNGCRILLGVRRRKTSIDIQVLDQGPGIKPEQLQTIFEEATQTPDDPFDKSMGLGLNAAKVIANILDADVSINSEYDKGTVCTLSIPTSNQSP